METLDQVPVAMEPITKAEDETATPSTLSATILPLVVNDVIGVVENQDVLPNNPEDEDHDPIGSSVLDNMEINMVHVLLAEF